MINNKFFDEHKKVRIEQLESFDYVRFKCLHEDEIQPSCKILDGEIERTSNGLFTSIWLKCDSERCGCQLYGESERSLKRKGVKLT
jgi:hypothetical protein